MLLPLLTPDDLARFSLGCQRPLAWASETERLKNLTAEHAFDLQLATDLDIATRRAEHFALGLPPAMVYRHPFPGPGLGVRILGEVRKEYADMLRSADAIFIEELRNFIDPATGKSWYHLTSQAFTVFLPVKSVGVMGDARTYDYVVALRAVQTSDFMTADWAELPYALLKKVSGRIINEVRGINRVTYDVSSKPPATIGWE